MSTTFTSKSAQHLGHIFIALIAISHLATITRADVTKVLLPGDYADFALDPRTGNVAALSAETNQVILLRADAMQAGRVEPAKTLRVGSTPCSIRYKQFGDLSVFAVVCSLDSHMFVIDTASFSLLSKIELSQSGVSLVTSSINPDDPFLYYNYASGHDSAAGVVSLRDMRNHGVAFGDSMDCAISASGEIAYRRGPWSPSGFESLLLTNKLTDDKPDFTRLFYDHTSTREYLPDPFDEFTASGTSIYSRGLEKKVASFTFTPRCFFRNRPIVVGVKDDRRQRRRRSNEDSTTVTVRAASYNTFSRVGDDITLEPEQTGDDGALPRGVPSQADFKQIVKRARMFADDARNRVVYAYRSTLCLIPLADFALPDEAFLRATLDGPERLRVGETYDMTVTPVDSRAKVTLVDLPDGVHVEGSRLRWTPTIEAVGAARFAVKLEHGDVQRTIRIRRDVVFPSTPLPLVAGGLAVASNGRLAAVWEGTSKDRRGRPVPPSDSTSALAVIDLNDGHVIASRQLLEPIERAIITDQHVVVQTLSSPKCEVLRNSDLQREKTIVADASIRRIEQLGAHMILQTTSGVEVYDAQSFDRIKRLETATPRRPSQLEASPITNHGLLVNGILYDDGLEPKLVLAAGGLPTLAGASQSMVAGASLKPLQNTEERRPVPHREGKRRITTRAVRGTNTQVSLELLSARTQVPGAVHTWHTRREIAVVTSGAVDTRQVLVRAQLPSGLSTPDPLLEAAREKAVVVDGDELYVWPIPGSSLGSAGASAAALGIVPRQTARWLACSGTTMLQHEVQGGKSPYHFSVRTPHTEAITIDQTTGTVSIDNEKIHAEALDALESLLTKQRRGGSYQSALDGPASGVRDTCAEILGRDPTGLPVAIPIHVEVSDGNLASDAMQYFVVAELPMADVREHLRPLQQKYDARRRAKEQGGTQSSETTELDDIKQRLATLEQTVELLTRLVNQLLEEREQDN